jgi:hypothetical protein
VCSKHGASRCKFRDGDECDKHPIMKGLCTTHYRMVHDSEDDKALLKKRTACTFADCDKKRVIRTYCFPHAREILPGAEMAPYIQKREDDAAARKSKNQRAKRDTCAYGSVDISGVWAQCVRKCKAGSAHCIKHSSASSGSSSSSLKAAVCVADMTPEAQYVNTVSGSGSSYSSSYSSSSGSGSSSSSLARGGEVKSANFE